MRIGNSRNHPSTESPPRGLVIWFCLVPALTAAAALVGWTFGIEPLKTVFPGLISMNPLTAMCLILLATALFLRSQSVAVRWQRLATALATIVATVGGLKIASYAVGFDVPIDRWLFAKSLADNRMAPNAAFCFLLSGMALIGIDRVTRRGFWLAQVPAMMVITISFLSLVGYSFGAKSLYQMASYVPMALHTAASLGVLALGILLARPERGVMAIVASPAAGGVMARRLLPAVLIIPWLLGGLRLMGQNAGYYDVEFGAALLIGVTVMLFVIAVAWIAAALNRSDAEGKQTMVALQRSSAEIFDLYNLAPCGYHSLDGNGIVRSINDTELAWLGYERGELVGTRRFADFIISDQPDFFRDNFVRLKQTGAITDVQFSLRRKNGSTFPVILNATAIYDADGSYVSSRSMLFDATEQKRSDAAIRRLNEELEQRVGERTSELAAANADLEQKNRENETFVYSASHDLRSPLVNLQGFSQELAVVAKSLRRLIAESALPAVDAERACRLIDVDMDRGVRFIQVAVGRLDAIIGALLRLSRAGRVEYRPQAVDTNQLVARILESMALTLFDRGVAVEVADLPACWCDPTAAEQVFANLIGNAVHYLDVARPGKIEIGSTPGERSAAVAGNSTTFYIKDNGLGIDAAYHGKIFLALKRLHPQVAEGDGIGLAIVKRIIDRHNGTIWFESEAGRGTTFFVNLPNARPKAELSTAARAHNPERNNHETQRTA